MSLLGPGPTRADLPLADLLDTDERPRQVLSVDPGAGLLERAPGGVARRRRADWLVVTDRRIHAVGRRLPGLVRGERRDHEVVPIRAVRRVAVTEPEGFFDAAVLASRDGHGYHMAVYTADARYFLDPVDTAAAATATEEIRERLRAGMGTRTGASGSDRRDDGRSPRG